jgi:hypothetical protein
MNRRRIISALVACALGFSLWKFSVRISGTNEPWDGSILRFCVVVFVGGAVCAAIGAPRNSWDKLYCPAAFVLGEIGYMSTQPDRWSLWPLSLIALTVAAIPAVVGVALVQRFTGTSGTK